MWITKLTKSISSVNLYKTKAKHIFETAKLLSQQNNIIPNTFEELIKFPGVWEKTAKVVLHVLYKQWVIAVDTHVHRVANRLGIVKTNSPLQTSKLLEKRIPKQYKDIAHDTIVLFWRYHCTARKPHCWTCKLQKICIWYKQNWE
jgi:endonuclease-3